MSHYIVELIIWSLIAYFAGCLIGWLLRTLFGSKEVAQPAPVKAEAPVPVRPAAAPEPVVAATPAVEPMPVARMERPRGLAEPRDGKPDDLQEISGIGPKNEKILHTLGFFHFDQIAAWGAGEVAWVDDHLKFNGRIGREKWVEQAKLLAAGDFEEFRRLYATGGERTRRT